MLKAEVRRRLAGAAGMSRPHGAALPPPLCQPADYPETCWRCGRVLGSDQAPEIQVEGVMVKVHPGCVKWPTFSRNDEEDFDYLRS